MSVRIEQLTTGGFSQSAEERSFFHPRSQRRPEPSRALVMETGGFGDSLEERIFFTGPPSTREPERRARLEARKEAAKIMRALVGAGTETEAHCERVALWSRRLARELGLSAERVLDIELGALLHDVGYVAMHGVDVDQPRPLTPAEWKELKKHCELGASILRAVPALRRAVPLVVSHHEEFDGTGYPRGLRGVAIPIDGRVFHLIDAYESLTRPRPYRQAVSDEQARAEIARRVGASFDPLVHAAFTRIDAVEWCALVSNVP